MGRIFPFKLRFCKACRDNFPTSEFYASTPNRCKTCVRARVAAHRSANIERVRAYDRSRDGLPHRVGARLEYQQTEAYRESLRASNARWTKKNKLARKAHTAVSNAIRDGKLVREACEECQSTSDVEGHHDDYSKPLDVRWLCVPCHASHHKRVRELAREAS